MTPKPAAPVTEAEKSQAFTLIQKAGNALAWSAGFIALPWMKVKGKTKFDRSVAQWTISADGTFTYNPDWLKSARPDERQFSIAHGALRFLLRHHDRGVDLGVVNPADGTAPEGKEHEHALWGEACASVVNAPLKADKIGHAPDGSVFPPADYAGSLDAESLYQHLLKVRPPPPPGQKPQGGGQQPPPNEGGVPQPPASGQAPGAPDSPNGGQQPQGGAGESPAPTPDEIDDMRRQVEALASQAGQGSSTCAMLRPKISRSNYRSVIGAGFSDSQTEASDRTQNTYSRVRRREALMEGLIQPGKIGSEPTICVVLDASGSVSRELLAKCAGECVKIATEFPNVRLLLITHTDRVEFCEWIRPGGDVSAITRATGYSGGTSFEPAYDRARELAPRGKFDALVHFTDGENFGDWPMPPARRLIVGLCGAETLPQPTPIRAKVMPVTEGEGRR